MIRVSNIKLSLEQVANAKEILITDIKEVWKYEDGKRKDKIIGYAYEDTAPKNKYEKFSIKVEEKSPVITAEELEAKGGVAKATANDFVGSFYHRGDDYVFTAKASKVVLL